MKKKTFWKVLAVVMMLVLTIGVLAACKPKGPEVEGPGGDVVVDTTVAEQAAFFDTMFGSANEIAESPVDVSEGKNIALNVGLTLTLAIGAETNALPIAVSAKGLLDRENVRVTSFTEDAATDKTGKWVWIGNYIDYDEAKHAGWERYKLSGTDYVSDANGAFVKDVVEFDKDKAAHKAATAVRYKGATFALTNANKTVLDISVKAGTVESLRIYYDVEVGDVNGDARGVLYVTLAGNKFKIDLNQVAAADNGYTKKIEDVVFNLIETKVLGNATLRSIIGSFGENFDLNKMLSGFILPLIKDIKVDNKPLIPEGKNLADVLLDPNGLGGKEILGMSVSSLVKTLFGDADKVKAYLGDPTKMDVQSILKQVGKMLFNNPKWSVYDANGKEITKSSNSYDLVKSDLKQKLKAEIQLGGSIGSKAVGATFLEGGRLSLGFIKEAGASGSTGKMDEFYLNVLIPKINGNKTINLNLAINDLAFGSTLASVEMAEMDGNEKAKYGAFAFEAGMKLNLAEEFMSVVFHRGENLQHVEGFDSDTDNDYEIVLGENNGGATLVNADGTKVYVPKKLAIEVAGALDFASPSCSDTKVVLNLVAKDYVTAGEDFTIATIQLFGAADGKSLVADIKAYDAKLVPYIIDLVAYQGNGNVAGFSKNDGKWGWWHEGYVKVALDNGFTAVVKDAATTGAYYEKSGTTYTLIQDITAVANGTTVYALKNNMAVKKAEGTYRAVRTGGNYFNAIMYKNVDGVYSVAESGYDGQLYVQELAFEAAAGKATITELYDSKGKVSYAASEAIDNFVKTGEMRITGINLYNLIFNESASVYIDEYYYLGTNGYAQAAAIDAGGSFDWLKNFLLNYNKNSGMLSSIAKLLAYSKTNGTLTLGGSNVLDVLFGATGVFTHSNSSKIPVSVYSALGYLVDENRTNLIDAYKKTEKSMQDLAERGIWLNGGWNPYIRLDRDETTVSAGEKLLAEWESATTPADRSIKEGALLKLGYKLVQVTETTAELYPLFLYENEITEWVDAYLVALCQGKTTDAANYKKMLEDCGFVINEIEKAIYDSNSAKFGFFAKTAYKDSVEVTKYARLTSKSVETLAEEWIAEEKSATRDGAKVANLRKALFRRGVASRIYKEDSEWTYYTTRIFMDEAMMEDADAIVQIYTKKNADKTILDNAGIKITLTYCEKVSTLDLYINFANEISFTEGKVDNDSIGFTENLLGTDGWKEFAIQIVK